MDKFAPTYDLEAFKMAVASGAVTYTKTCIRDARSLGLALEQMKGVVATMGRRNFYKSTASLADHKVWQDVYHVHHDDLVIYIKFTTDQIQQFCLLSFKEK